MPSAPGIGIRYFFTTALKISQNLLKAAPACQKWSDLSQAVSMSLPKHKISTHLIPQAEALFAEAA